MIPVDSRSRKRSGRTLATLGRPEESRKKKTREDRSAPVVCLTGLSPDEKIRYHRIVQKLGGKFTRNLDTSVNTHLISSAADGLKYEAAASIPSFPIVTPGWLDACAKMGQWLPEQDFLLQPPSDNLAEQTVNKSVVIEPLLPIIERSLRSIRPNSQLFLDCHVYLVGLDAEPEVIAKCGRLLRRGKATIHWRVSGNLTHIVVADGLDHTVRDAARMLVQQHSNFPVVVSPRWITSSWEQNMLQKAEDFQPHYIQKVVEPVAAQKSPSKRQSTSLFHGSLFAFIRISPPADVVDFDREELEHLSTSHGGRILSHEIIHALRMDKSNGSEPRTCFVVCWGSYEKSSLSVHSFVAQLMNEKLAEIVLVTPVWLQTCIAEQRQLLPSRLPAIFTPTCQPLRKVKLSAAEKSEEITTQLRVCVTGYTGFRRKAIQLVLEAMGAEYDETLRQSTSYLICKDASGSKYEKAREWKIHTVSIEWLYHIATVGWVAPQPGCPGCEAKFSIASE